MSLRPHVSRRLMARLALAGLALLTSAAVASAAQLSQLLNPGDTFALTCQTGIVHIQQSATSISGACATPTPVPTSVPAATPTPVPGAFVNGVPICQAQDSTVWHPLVARDSSGAVVCTYGHEHGMNPHTGDSVFGALPLAQEISYPWATVNASGVAENGVPNKHRVYKWLVDNSLPCLGGAPDGSNKAVTAFREELHADGSLGAAVRFHSFFGQYRLTDCGTGQSGTLQVGGHMDYAFLNLNGSIVPLTGDPPAGCNVNGDRRVHGTATDPLGQSVWYGTNNRQPGCDDAYGFTPHVTVQLNVGVNDFGPVDPLSPTTVHSYNNPAQNETHIGTDTLTIYLAGLPTDANGLVSFTGHTDRHGNVVPEVAGQVVGQDYIPLAIANAKPGAYGASTGPNVFGVGYNGDVAGPSGQAGYYVQPPQS